MTKNNKNEGEFRHVGKKFRSQTIIVCFIDLVGFTSLDSNEDLFRAVRYMESQIDIVCRPEYYWAERDARTNYSARNNLLLIPTGDGYGLAFDHKHDDLEVFDDLLKIYKFIKEKHRLRMGINKGENYIVTDINEDINLVGWGINFAQRAIMKADPNQIVCNKYFVEPILSGHKELEKEFTKIEPITIKGQKYEFYNFQRDDLGISI